MNELIELWIKVTKERELEELPKEINDLYDYTVKLQQEYERKLDFIKWLESKNQFHYKNGKIEDNYILVSEVLDYIRR